MRVLVIDDDLKSCELIKRSLEKDFKKVVVECYDFLPDIENTAFLDGPDYNWKVIKAFKQKKYTVANILYPDWDVFEKNGFELLPNKPKNTFYHFVMIRRNF